MRLAVELQGTQVGVLSGDARDFDFAPSDAGMDRFGTNSTALSVVIPLAPDQRRDHAGRRRNWFAELLPEGDQYDYMLAQAGLHRGDTLAFLARYGRDVAGALQIWDLDDPTEPRTPGLKSATDAEVRALLEDPTGSPLANENVRGKSSLGGVQPKIVLVKTSRGWAQSLGGYPTTHIIKPRLDGENSSVIFDEEYGSRLARRVGLADFNTTVTEFDGLPALVIERFDRAAGERIHQEDFSQALGARRNEKYQEIGGVVSLRRVGQTLTRHAAPGELRRLARMLVLAVATGNLDMHTKNIGLLHPTEGDVRLAPAYDVVPQKHLRNDGKLALAVNKKYNHSDVTREDLVAECGAWGLRRPGPVVDETLEEIRAAVAAETPLDGAFPSLQEQIAADIDALRAGRPIPGRRKGA
ncbi:type II toxin-antitoxin system HipA family toxin [Zafaria sp. Z1313]|uniref:type II toxin-antitoxin system HipA family toxin n=1 Tax=Zafaria sp. Z1313 TaxID=3423202 RepID=UPI003D301849